jgi:hypothetical protein
MSDQGQISIRIELFGIGVLDGYIIRHLSPFSADAILRKLPLNLRGRFNFGGKQYWTLPGVKIFKGTNSKSLKSVTKGSIVYNPKSDELIIMIEDYEMPNKVNKLGEISNNLQVLLKARNGLTTKISRR